MIFRKIVHLPVFNRDIKKLKKRFISLDDDLDVFIKVQLNLFHKQNIDNAGIVQISGIGIESPQIFKARKFACKSLKGKGARTGIRVIYAYFKEEDKIELIEIYYKGDKENENRDRILKIYK